MTHPRVPLRDPSLWRFPAVCALILVGAFVLGLVLQ